MYQRYIDVTSHLNQFETSLKKSKRIDYRPTHVIFIVHRLFKSDRKRSITVSLCTESLEKLSMSKFVLVMKYSVV